MHPVAKTCIKWSITLFAVGLVITLVTTNVVTNIAQTGIYYSMPLVTFLSNLVGTMQWMVFPTAGALIAAAVVINTLAPRITPNPPGTFTPPQNTGHNTNL